MHANADEQTELFWALKYGSTNYGVVTRFTMKTSEAADVWGGAQVFRTEHASKLLHNLVELTLGFGKEVQEFMGVLLSDERIWVPRLLIGDTTGRRDFGLPAMVDTMHLRDRANVYEEWVWQVGDLKPVERHQWYTLTIKPDARFAMDIFGAGQRMFNGKGSFSVTFQPLPGHMFDDGEAVLSELCISSSQGSMVLTAG